MYHGAVKPLLCNYSACALKPQLLKPVRLETLLCSKRRPRTATRESPLLPSATEKPTNQKRPRAAKNEINEKRNYPERLPSMSFIHLSFYSSIHPSIHWRFQALSARLAAAAAAASLQLCLTLCDPTDGSPAGSPVPGILQARTLAWAAISSSNAWKWKVKVKSLSRDPTDCSLPGSSVHGIFQARGLEWVATAGEGSTGPSDSWVWGWGSCRVSMWTGRHLQVPGPGRSPEEGNGYPLQNPCLENLMDRGARQATVHGAAESDTTEWLTHTIAGHWSHTRLLGLFFLLYTVPISLPPDLTGWPHTLAFSREGPAWDWPKLGVTVHVGPDSSKCAVPILFYGLVRCRNT